MISQSNENKIEISLNFIPKKIYSSNYALELVILLLARDNLPRAFQ